LQSSIAHYRLEGNVLKGDVEGRRYGCERNRAQGWEGWYRGSGDDVEERQWQDIEYRALVRNPSKKEIPCTGYINLVTYQPVRGFSGDSHHCVELEQTLTTSIKNVCRKNNRKMWVRVISLLEFEILLSLTTPSMPHPSQLTFCSFPQISKGWYLCHFLRTTQDGQDASTIVFY
jgi:hypothetical protein